MKYFYRLSFIAQNVGFGLFLIRMLFRIMHYPYADTIGFASGVLIVFGVALQFYFSKNKTWIEYLSLFAVIVIGASLMSPLVYPSISGLLGPFIIPSIIFLIASQFFSKNEKEESPTRLDNYQFGESDFQDLTEHQKNDNTEASVTKQLSRTLFYIFGAIGILGLLFKFQHYPGASIMTIVGFAGTAISVLLNTFFKK
jgi:hypothetical protein